MDDLIYQPMFWLKVYGVGCVLFVGVVTVVLWKGWYHGRDISQLDLLGGLLLSLSSWPGVLLLMLVNLLSEYEYTVIRGRGRTYADKERNRL